MTGRDEVFGRVTDAVGDLDNPFYAEERQRDVWNEASAVGFQALLWGITALACAMAWVGGADQAGWAFGLLTVLGVGSWLAIGHARRHGVSGTEGVRMLRLRVGAWLALYLATLLGIAYHLPWDDAPGNMGTGVVVGLLIGTVLGVVALVLGSRKDKTGDA